MITGLINVINRSIFTPNNSWMRLYIDIAHPAYAHALRFFIKEMLGRGHEVLVSARDKDVTHCLLSAWGISFTGRGKGAESLSGKLTDLAAVLWRLLPEVRKFRPDLVMSYSSYQAALIGRLLGCPVITFEDTEPVELLHTINRLLSTKMVTPACFEKDFGPAHIRFEGYKELASLHPSRFGPLPVPVRVEKPYIILRFVSWKAWHDRGHPGITDKMKHVIAEKLSLFGRVFISSEDPLPPGLSRYIMPGDCELGHSMLAGATLLLGESASMAAEAAVLGVPAIYIDNTGRGYTRELERKYSLMYSFGEDQDSVEKALSKAVELLGNRSLLEEWQSRRLKMLEGKVDLTSWMIELAENF
jgi:uncharacterized protein